ncbi:MAG: hypothetical protein ACR2HR_17235 [Euzebya sp.]
MTRRLTLHLPALALALLALLLGACTADTSGSQPELAGQETVPELGFQRAGEAQPGAGPGSGPGNLVDGDFAEIPVPTAAEALNESSNEQGVTSQSFSVTSMTLQQVAAHFEDVLPPLGWEPGQTDQSGETASGEPQQLQVTWFKANRTLLIAVAQQGGDSVQMTMQLSG